MYHIVVVAVIESDNREDKRETKGFDYWSDAAQWITDLANEENNLLAVRMLRTNE